MKRENFEKFVQLIRNQFEHGGEKYALNSEKEITDWVCEIDPNWVLGTMAKYIGRYKNFKRERDLLKIANYAYILWLKDEWHLKKKHDEDISKDKEEI